MSSPSAYTPGIKVVSSRADYIRNSLPTIIGVIFGCLLMGLGFFSSYLTFHYN